MMAAVRLLRWWLASSECFMVIARGLQAAAFAVGIERGVAAVKEDRYNRIPCEEEFMGFLVNSHHLVSQSVISRSRPALTPPPARRPAPSPGLAQVPSGRNHWLEFLSPLCPAVVDGDFM